MIYTLTMNPAMDLSITAPGFAPGKTHRIALPRQDPGGKGINVTRTLNILHEESIAMGILGGRTGDLIADRLREEGLLCDFTWGEAETRTNWKITDPESGITTELNQAGLVGGEEILARARGRLLHLLQPGDIAALCGSLPADAPAGFYRDLIRECHNIGAEVLLDTGGEALALAVSAAPWCVKPNREELQSLVGYRIETRGDAAEAAWQLLGHGIRQVVVSLGAQGALLATREAVLFAAAPEITAQSTTGAGDAMVAALLHARLQGFSPADTLRFAVAAAAAKVVREGTQPPVFSDIGALLPMVEAEEL